MPCSIITREIPVPPPTNCCIDIDIPSGATVLGVFTRKFDGKVIPSIHVAVPSSHGDPWVASSKVSFFICSENYSCEVPWPYPYIGSFQLKPSGEVYHVFRG